MFKFMHALVELPVDMTNFYQFTSCHFLSILTKCMSVVLESLVTNHQVVILFVLESLVTNHQVVILFVLESLVTNHQVVILFVLESLVTNHQVVITFCLGITGH